jgi:hypothetical protein
MSARATNAQKAAPKAPPVHAVLREEIAKVVQITERLYGIVDGTKRTNHDELLGASPYAAPSHYFPARREEYLRRVLQDAVADECMSLGAVGARLEDLVRRVAPKAVGP